MKKGRLKFQTTFVLVNNKIFRKKIVYYFTLLFKLLGFDYLLLPKIKDNTAKTKKQINRILAIPAALPAMPPKPRKAAMMAMTKKTTA
ncbi:hypothetical protein HMPREF2907_08470 [Neisseria sp. HMSC055H02]|nr:hypothetical protein HMPREF2907_08470 [Neisseria sp. HMSC055H02]